MCGKGSNFFHRTWINQKGNGFFKMATKKNGDTFGIYRKKSYFCIAFPNNRQGA